MTATAAPHRAWALDLGTRTRYELLRLRVDMFVVEQACPYPELDGRDLLPGRLRIALAEVGSAPCRLSPQTHLVDRYAKHGFSPDGYEFIEDGIPHVPMRRGGGEHRREG